MAGLARGMFSGLWLAVAAGAVSVGCLRKPPGAQHPSVETTRAALREAQTGQRPSDRTLYVNGRHLYDRCGEQVILRGINKMVIWTDPEGESFSEIAKTGANSVRVVWTVKDHPGPEQLDRVLGKAQANRLIPIIELHDATGKLPEVPKLVDFWTRPEIVGVLRRHEGSLLLNIANEAGGNGVRTEEFVGVYRRAISRIRDTGLTLPLVIDAPSWGQDIDVLQAAAPELLRSDPRRNLLFSVHMWWPDGGSKDPGSRQRIVAELEESVAMGLPLIVGEFAHTGVGCKGEIAYRTILRETQKHRMGWLAWSWGPGNQDCHEMDMTRDGRFGSLEGWGLEVAVTDPNGIKRTSKIPESMYRGQCPRRIGTAQP